LNGSSRSPRIRGVGGERGPVSGIPTEIVERPNRRRDDAVGGRVGDYEILRRIGSGGSGDVFLARGPWLDQPVALKVLAHARDSVQRERFLREARVLRALHHPNIVDVYDVGEADGVDYLVMRYVDGPSMEAAAPMPLNDVLLATIDVCAALEYAHANGVIHRDVKPSNILLDKQRGAQLVDFGIAKELGGERDISPSLTVTGAVCGTPGFLSPEQAKGTRELTPATDIYSLGATLYALTTGKVPFADESFSMSLVRTISGELKPPSHANPELPREIEALILRAMHPDHRRRCTAAELAEDVRRYLDGQPVQSVFTVFADQVKDAQDRGWRARRRVLVLAEGDEFVRALEPRRLGSYELKLVRDASSAGALLRQQAFDAVVATDEVTEEAVCDVFLEARREQPDAARIFLCCRAPALALLEQVTTKAGLDAIVSGAADGDPLGKALDRVFAPDGRADASAVETVRALQREVRALKASLALKSRDLEAKSTFLEEKLKELKRAQRTIVSLSEEARARESTWPKTENTD
jgi:predicted Ser/Thr protein kinase